MKYLAFALCAFNMICFYGYNCPLWLLVFSIPVFYLTCLCVEYLYNLHCDQPALQYLAYKKPVFHVSRSESIPFSVLKIDDNSDSEGFKLLIKSDATCFVRGFWNVKIYDFSICLDSYEEMKNIVTSTEECWNGCLSSTEPFELLQDEETSKTFNMPSHIRESVLHHNKEKDVYPFVIIFVSASVSEVVVAHALNVSYEFPHRCIGEIGQFIKTKDGRKVEVLKPYLSTFSAVGNGEDKNLCIICLNEVVSMIFMPCRHSCVCNVCYKKFDKCPVCRSLVRYYIQIDSVEQ